jgi:uncharacterized membrane protein YeaQ/YmgE (transglycosylase-associated protein family)
MSIAAWIIIGLLSGYGANRGSTRASGELARETLFGVAGALGGGFCYHALAGRGGPAGAAEIGLSSILAAMLGAVLLLAGRRWQRRYMPTS